jgi:hypothetical protein
MKLTRNTGRQRSCIVGFYTDHDMVGSYRFAVNTPRNKLRGGQGGQHALP